MWTRNHERCKVTCIEWRHLSLTFRQNYSWPVRTSSNHSSFCIACYTCTFVTGEVRNLKCTCTVISASTRVPRWSTISETGMALTHQRRFLHRRYYSYFLAQIYTAEHQFLQRRFFAGWIYSKPYWRRHQQSPSLRHQWRHTIDKRRKMAAPMPVSCKI